MIPVLFKDWSDCCGCEACRNVCPTGSIRMNENAAGFIYPSINAETCVGCNMCVKVCPLKSSNKDISHPEKAYGAVSKSEALHRSASGGVFYALAKELLLEYGVIYGAAFDRSFNVEHIRVDRNTDLSLLQGSKYVQSRLNNTFKDVEEDLENGKTVLFSGTPCQVKALDLYLDTKKTSKEHLITIDIVCHGVPRQKMFDDYLDTLESENNYIKDFTFRDKNIGWGKNGGVTYSNGKKKKLWEGNEPYLYYFSNCSIFRNSCYECPFASIYNRPGDITICDFWGIEKTDNKFASMHNNGISGVILNTQKGEELFNRCIDCFDITSAAPEKIAEGNSQLKHPSNRPEKSITKMYANEGWSAVESEFRKDTTFFSRNKCRLKTLIPYKLKVKLKK